MRIADTASDRSISGDVREVFILVGSGKRSSPERTGLDVARASGFHHNPNSADSSCNRPEQVARQIEELRCEGTGERISSRAE